MTLSSHLSKSFWQRALAGLVATLFALTSAQFAAAQTGSLTPVEKAKIHYILSNASHDNMRAIGGGGYNYADPKTNPYGHFQSDINPWIMMGGSRGDTSSPKSRIKAYVADLESGVLTTHDLWPTLTEADISKAGSVELPRVWSNVFKAEKPRSLLGLIGSENTLSSSTLKKPMKAVRKQLQKEY